MSFFLGKYEGQARAGNEGSEIYRAGKLEVWFAKNRCIFENFGLHIIGLCFIFQV